MHRRPFLTTSVTILLSGLAGCVTGFKGFGSVNYMGSVRIRNEHDQAHTVSITVQKISEDEDVVHGKQGLEIATPTTTPIWEREQTFDVPANDIVEELDFFTEPGAYYIEVEVDSGATGATWLGLYRAADGGVAEEMLSVYIGEDGHLNVDSPTAE